MKFSLLIFLTVFVLCMGCGAPANNAATPDSTADVASDAAEQVESVADADVSEDNAGASDAFKNMAFGERKAFMKDVVMPEMKPLFIDNHPDFSCISCHGDDMMSKNYEMPNTLAPLNPTAMPFESEDPKQRAAAEFMKEKVVPKMAGLLKEAPYDPQTKSGFGCFDCHATAQ